MSYNSKYTGQQVEELLDKVSQGDVGDGYSKEEVDAKFAAVEESIKDIDGEITPTYDEESGKLTLS